MEKQIMRVVLVITFIITRAIDSSSGQSLPCQLANGQPCTQQLCPNTRVNLTCNIPSDKLGIITRWTTISPNCTLDLDQQASVDCSGKAAAPSLAPSCSPFMATNTITPAANLPCNTSMLSFIMSASLNGTLITCATTTVSGIIGSIMLNSVAPPTRPKVFVISGPSNLMVTWVSYEDSLTFTIIINENIINSSLTNQTSTIYGGLPSDTSFNIAVMATNCAGSVTSYVNTWTLPLPPSNIMVQQDLQDMTTQLTISWTHVGGNVSQYNVMSSSQGFNVTSSLLVKDSCLGSRCTFNQVVKTTGDLYSVRIASINAGGVGPWSDPKQGILIQATSQVSLGVGIGIGLVLPIVILVTLTIAGLSYWLYKRQKHSIFVPGPLIQEKQLASLELRLYAINWPEQKQEYLTCMYITNELNGCVLELKDDPGDDHHVVVNRVKLPPTDNQQWYLIDSDNDTFLIVSKKNGKVLSCENSQTPSKDSVLWRRNKDHIMSVSRENFALGIKGGHKEPGYPLVLCTVMEDDKSQMFEDRPAILSYYVIEHQKKCEKKIHDSRSCKDCNRCVEMGDTHVFGGTPCTPQSSDAQRWYIEYLHGQSDGSFLIISKLNGKALYCKGGGDGLEVKAAERNDDDESQHWKREGFYIVSKILNMIFFLQPNNTHQIVLIRKKAILSNSDNRLRSSFAIRNCSDDVLCLIQSPTQVLDQEHFAKDAQPRTATPTDAPSTLKYAPPMEATPTDATPIAGPPVIAPPKTGASTNGTPTKATPTGATPIAAQPNIATGASTNATPTSTGATPIAAQPNIASPKTGASTNATPTSTGATPIAAQPNIATPIDSQQWYLHSLPNGHYLVASKLHEKVLTYQVDEVGHSKCFVSNFNGGKDQQWKIKKDGSIVSVKYENYVVGKCAEVKVDL